METVLIKLSGEFLCNAKGFDHARLEDFVNQIKQLANNSKIGISYKIGIVVGGGNFFRASKQGNALKMRQTNADSVGMLATVMNGLILQDILHQVDLNATVLSAFSIDSIVPRITQSLIDSALAENKIIIFVGGTGNPFFTTDTNAVLRALQIGAKQVWKATKVAGIYSADPLIDKNAKKFKSIEYAKVIENNLKIIDATAITLAAENKVKIRVFNVFEKDALLKVAKDSDFGSTIK
jgi:uridylate kinase